MDFGFPRRRIEVLPLNAFASTRRPDDRLDAGSTPPGTSGGRSWRQSSSCACDRYRRVVGAEVVWGPLPDGFEEEADNAASMDLSFGGGGSSGEFETLDRKRFAGPDDAWITVTALGPINAEASDWRIETEQSRSRATDFIVGACNGCRVVILARGVGRDDLLALLHGSSAVQH